MKLIATKKETTIEHCQIADRIKLYQGKRVQRKGIICKTKKENI